MESFSIGQLAERAGVHLETIRFYERRGLMAEPPRSPAGYRQYAEQDLWRLEFIGRAKRLGFTLSEIADLIGDDEQRSTRQVLDAAHAKIATIEAEQAALATTRSRLHELVVNCEGANVSDCVSLDVSR